MNWQNLPKLPGVYFFKNESGKIIYVGKAKSLKDRVSSYFQPPEKLLPKTAQLMEDARSLDHIVVESEIDALLFEANLIRKFQPRYNVDWKDGKSYPLIEITVKDKIPMVMYARQELNPSSKYFGPYPTGSDLTSLLRFLRRVFPFVSQPHPRNRACFRSHIGLCPCPDVFTDQKARAKYKRDIANLIAFLEGKRQTVQKKLEKEMLEAAKMENFEQAGLIKAKLSQIANVTAYRTRPAEYEANPNLFEDRRQEELDELQKILNIPKISKIECFDISNTSGKNATGAQVVFVNGVPDKNLYRRYKIKLKETPNDFAMMNEMISRRLHSDISLPELIIIDGGKGQLGALPKIPTNVIGLAKRLETIITMDGKEINLQEGSPALNLIQRLRDEAHRFSRKYHFLLRKNSMFS